MNRSGTTPDTAKRTAALADIVIKLGELALAFGRINRTAVYHPDGITPESDTDHTVMLGWVACSLAAQYFPHLNIGLVAEFALVHDAPEVYAGDTNTLRISDQGRAAKADRERAAVRRLVDEYGSALPWLPTVLQQYEAQVLPEARFVRGVDKILPKCVHLLDGCVGLREQALTPEDLIEVFERQRIDMEGYVGEFAELLMLRAELVDRTVALHTANLKTAEELDDLWGALGSAKVRFWRCLNPAHETVTWEGDVATCGTCGLNSDMTRRYARNVRTHVLAQMNGGRR